MLLFLSSFRVLLSCFFSTFNRVNYTKECRHACQAGYIHTDSDVYVPDISKVSMNFDVYNTYSTVRTVWYLSLPVRLCMLTRICVCCIAYTILFYYIFLSCCLISFLFIPFHLFCVTLCHFINFYFMSLYFILSYFISSDFNSISFLFIYLVAM